MSLLGVVALDFPIVLIFLCLTMAQLQLNVTYKNRSSLEISLAGTNI
jgi:hypothetical protein